MRPLFPLTIHLLPSAFSIEIIEQLPDVGQHEMVVSSSSSKPQLFWNWKRGGATEKHPIPEKKKKTDDDEQNKQKKNSENYFCLECLEISLQRPGKRDEKFVTLSRCNPSSVKRHKTRWHNTTTDQTCTIVPSNAPEVHQLNSRKEKKKSKASTNKRYKRQWTTSTSQRVHTCSFASRTLAT